MKNIFEAKKPQFEDLTPYIAYYYFHQAGNNSAPEKFTYYPNIKNALSIYKGSTLEHIDAFTTLSSPSDIRYSCGYTNLISHFARAEIRTPFDKTGVVFQPLGLNHFISESQSALLNQTFNLDLHLFKEPFYITLDAVYATSDLTKKVSLLDSFFQKAFKGFHDHKMKMAMNLILTEGAVYTVQQLADKLEVSRKTLLRMFKKHLNCTVREYLQVIKFRKAVDHYQASLKNSTLTNLAYEMDYNDQSEFIHHFKRLTGFSPKPFFKSLNLQSDQGTYWSKKL